MALNYSKHPTLLCKDFQIGFKCIFNLEQNASHCIVCIPMLQLRESKLSSHLPSHISLVCASTLTLSLCKKPKTNSIKRFDISWRNTTAQQYSLWQTAGRVIGRLQPPTKMSPPGFATTALIGKKIVTFSDQNSVLLTDLMVKLKRLLVTEAVRFSQSGLQSSRSWILLRSIVWLDADPATYKDKCLRVWENYLTCMIAVFGLLFHCLPTLLIMMSQRRASGAPS